MVAKTEEDKKAEAEAKAEQEQREAAAKAADDEGGEPVEQGPFAGQLVATQHYAAVTTEFQGRQVVEVRPEGWVGPGFEFPARRIKEVIALLRKVKSLPEQDENDTK